MEKCAGCGILTNEQHPVAGVMNANEAGELGFDTSNPSEHGFIEVPVCAACHADPAHRVFPLKCHFFIRALHDVASAVRRAGPQQPGHSIGS